MPSHICKCLLDISAWLSPRHFKLHRATAELGILVLPALSILSFPAQWMAPLSTPLLKQKTEASPWCLSLLTWPIHQKIPSSLVQCLTNIIAPHLIQVLSSLLWPTEATSLKGLPSFCPFSSSSATHQPDHVTSALNPSDDIPLWPNPTLTYQVLWDLTLIYFLDPLLSRFPPGFYASTIMVVFSSLSLAKLLPDSRSLYWPCLLFGTSLYCYGFFFSSFISQHQSYLGWGHPWWP